MVLWVLYLAVWLIRAIGQREIAILILFYYLGVLLVICLLLLALVTLFVRSVCLRRTWFTVRKQHPFHFVKHLSVRWGVRGGLLLGRRIVGKVVWHWLRLFLLWCYSFLLLSLVPGIWLSLDVWRGGHHLLLRLFCSGYSWADHLGHGLLFVACSRCRKLCKVC